MKKTALHLAGSQLPEGSWPDPNPLGAAAWATQALAGYLSSEAGDALEDSERRKISACIEKGNGFLLARSLEAIGWTGRWDSGTLGLGAALSRLGSLPATEEHYFAIRRLAREAVKVNNTAAGEGSLGLGSPAQGKIFVMTAVLNGIADANHRLEGPVKNQTDWMIRRAASMLRAARPQSSPSFRLACEYALRAFGYEDSRHLRRALDDFIAQARHMEKFKLEGEASDPFYLMGLYYAARANRSLGEAGQAAYSRELRLRALKLQNPDGSWPKGALGAQAAETAVSLLTLLESMPSDPQTAGAQ